MTDRCDYCGDEGVAVETLGFDERGTDSLGGFWRVGRVCEDCRERWLMPTLRWFFSKGGGTNPSPWLKPPNDGAFAELKSPGAVFRAFTAESGTTHVAREVRTGPALGWRSFCVALCGVSAFAEPEDRTRPLDGRGESVVCGRCRAADDRGWVL